MTDTFWVRIGKTVKLRPSDALRSLLHVAGGIKIKADPGWTSASDVRDFDMKTQFWGNIQCPHAAYLPKPGTFQPIQPASQCHYLKGLVGWGFDWISCSNSPNHFSIRVPLCMLGLDSNHKSSAVFLFRLNFFNQSTLNPVQRPTSTVRCSFSCSPYHY